MYCSGIWDRSSFCQLCAFCILILIYIHHHSSTFHIFSVCQLSTRLDCSKTNRLANVRWSPGPACSQNQRSRHDRRQFRPARSLKWIGIDKNRLTCDTLVIFDGWLVIFDLLLSFTVVSNQGKVLSLPLVLDSRSCISLTHEIMPKAGHKGEVKLDWKLDFGQQFGHVSTPGEFISFDLRSHLKDPVRN